LGAAISNKSAASSAYSKALADPSTSAADLAKLESASNAATASMAQAAGASLQGVQSILGSVVGGLDELGMLTEDQKKTANEVIGMVGGAANLAMGIASGNPMQIIQGSVDLLVNGFKLFDSKSRAAEKDIKKQQELIDSLKKSYDDLETAVSKSFSTAKANLVTQEMENLKQQNEAIAKQMQDERDKKKTDENAVKEYQNTIDENNKKIAELKDSYLEALTGTDVMSAIDSFAQAYSDAWTSGENAAKKSTDLVKDLLKKSLVEYLKNQIQPEVKSLMEAIGNAMTDGIISDAELAQIEAEKQMIDAQAASQQKQFDKLGLGSSSSGVTGELQSAMTEGTGSQLVGLWNMTAMDIRWIREWLAIKSGVSPVEGSTDVVKVLQDTLTETKRISDNTKKSADNSDLILSELRDLNNKPNNNNNNGSRRSAL
jgi:hypothetical protein